MLKVGTICSGIGAYEQSLINQEITHQIKFACEIDALARKQYLANYQPELFAQDLTTLDATSFNNQIDILVGGTPCQSFSRANSSAQGLHDSRGELFFHFIRIINECTPKFFIFENVQGVLSHDQGHTWQVMTHSFDSLDYQWSYQVLNARHFDNAQNRPRLFVVAIRSDIDQVFTFPERKALNHDSTDYLDAYTDDQESNNTSYHHMTQRQVERLLGQYKIIVNQWNHKRTYGGMRLNPEIMQCMTAQQIVSSSGNYYIDLTSPKIDETGFRFSCEWLRSQGASEDKIHALLGDNPSARIRSMSAKEMLRAQGFSDSFVDVCSFYQTSKQVGNSISVRVLEALNDSLNIS